ncbi:pyridoxamine-5'-phosphate oxidase-related FMN-binding protein [Geotalea daltonii FRC-32]|uniref:Pyridoxamine-5'-phosphate oxidase-related FMN-binding protein n=1 Tax=Geotalea daltonii (strain DSM 22248 / JCM 15807 / FRC-32) TaxID=316067 RepID=B9M3B2_GEODF|nr:pyridoxamine 5'-phosphate oxidase family protein [Geotalea daltonii]ACM19522.1 pyridoxamine-5'-phosphate oxidase-related FMN-binding protein [Geotalea daltonii FRC-32]
MEREELIELINRNPVFHLATIEEGEPRVRGMLVYLADDRGILFHTGAMKDVHRQMIADPAVELCFHDWQANIQVRVRGKAKLVDDQALKEEIVNSPGREFLKPWIEASGYSLMSVFRVEGCQALAWTMESNFAPKEWVTL